MAAAGSTGSTLLSFPAPQAPSRNQSPSGDTSDSEVPETATEGDLTSFIVATLSMNNLEAADAITGRVCALDNVLRTGFVHLGILCREMRDRQLWRWVIDPDTMKPFTSMGAWIIRSAPYSYRHCHGAMTALDQLKDIPTETLSNIPQCNIAQLQRMSTAVRSQPEVIEAASKLSEREFVEKVAKDYPDQHIEAKNVRWMLSGSLAKLAGEAIEVAMYHCDVKTRDEALEAIFADFIASYSVPMQ